MIITPVPFDPKAGMRVHFAHPPSACCPPSWAILQLTLILLGVFRATKLAFFLAPLCERMSEEGIRCGCARTLSSGSPALGWDHSGSPVKITTHSRISRPLVEYGGTTRRPEEGTSSSSSSALASITITATNVRTFERIWMEGMMGKEQERDHFFYYSYVAVPLTDFVT